MNSGFCKKTKLLAVIFVGGVFFSNAQNPLFIPPVLSGTNFNLNVQTGTTQFIPSINTPTYGVNGPVLGPTLILNKWDQVTMNVTNSLPSTTTTMHWHGLHVPAYADGGPHQIIAQGTTWSPSFTVLNDAGTYWYHPHGENKTDFQVSKGIAGFIIVRDSEEAALTLPRTYGADDFPILIQTKAFDVLNQTAIATALDTVLVVNATRNPYLDLPAQVVRLRLLDGSSDRSYLLGFSDSSDFYQITTDGGLLAAPVQMNKLQLSNGERAEILVDLTGKQGQIIYLRNYGSQLPNGIIGSAQVGNGTIQIPDYNLNPLNGADFNVLEIHVVAPTASPVTTIPSTLRTITPWNQSQVVVQRTLVIRPDQMGLQFMVDGPFQINGHSFSMDTINVIAYLNNIEKWTLKNLTWVAHPFHMHDIQFYVTDINGGAVPLNMQGKKDVVMVMPGDSVSFITKFEDFADDSVPYMYHCHLLHHEDDGMMGSFLVLDTTTQVNEIFSDENFSVFPNPADESFVISHMSLGNTKEVKVDITDIFGRMVLTQYSLLNTQYNISRLPDGIYFVSLRESTGKTHIQKLIIQHNF